LGDRDPQITDILEGWPFHTDLLSYREKNLHADEVFWDPKAMNLEDLDSDQLKVARILACGSAGVGKTTLISKVLKVDGEGSKNEHGIHDIELGIPSQDGKCIIHDSRGFQGGDVAEVEILKTFLKNRATNPDLIERLHVIWYVAQMILSRWTNH
jgi:hypothetical protein